MRCCDGGTAPQQQRLGDADSIRRRPIQPDCRRETQQGNGRNQHRNPDHQLGMLIGTAGRHLHAEKQQLLEQNARLQSDINHYQTEYQSYSKDNSAIEKQAREELNLVKPGETVYKFGKTDSH